MESPQLSFHKSTVPISQFPGRGMEGGMPSSIVLSTVCENLHCLTVLRGAGSMPKQGRCTNKCVSLGGLHHATYKMNGGNEKTLNLSNAGLDCRRQQRRSLIKTTSHAVFHFPAHQAKRDNTMKPDQAEHGHLAQTQKQSR
jgi:hypothetical protein